ncbi:putative RING finger domain protein [Aspergillus homomorphus CBS 101889]|uniref:RING-type domain-containing protein n=1 Tax=Aspergillus homomorphus (strain CBS 101889) TaxID=1450537 RepID=A0A395I4K4_ASPHC|nr:hypothetical protein BO97DRAFT_476118 [Aspergillus homomorphus CBS 101889]RAL15142.1 hypothetical protein BO97DRAFT_476118 [Aspergillus homomorphus CBS 101889]
MAHSKRNTSLPHFTSYERSLLRSAWGTKRSVIGRDSFLPFGACRLCLRPARAPVVACATAGDLFCRECAISDLLAQRQEIKRLERRREEARKRLVEEESRALEEVKGREVREFEDLSMGFQSNRSGHKVDSDSFLERGVEAGGKRKVEGEEDGGEGRRKVFKLDEEVVRRGAERERERLREELRVQKDAKSALPSFWVPSLTPSTDPDEIAANKPVKLTPICPASTETNKHGYSLKGLVDVHFTEEKGAGGELARVCPSCKKTFTNGLKAMLTKPCGHVICQPCVNKFMTPHAAPDPHASKEEQAQTAALHGRILCYVCETDVTPDVKGPSKKKKKDKEGIAPGLVEIRGF